MTAGQRALSCESRNRHIACKCGDAAAICGCGLLSLRGYAEAGRQRSRCRPPKEDEHRPFLVAVIPVAATSIGVGPIPAQIWSGAWRHGANDGNRDECAERYSRNHRAIVGSARPGSGEPIGPAPPGPRPAVPTGTAAPILDRVSLSCRPCDKGTARIDPSRGSAQQLGSHRSHDHPSYYCVSFDHGPTSFVAWRFVHRTPLPLSHRSQMPRTQRAK